jgi:hypothetical protein
MADKTKTTYTVEVKAKVGGAVVKSVPCGTSKSYAGTVAESMASVFKSDKYTITVKESKEVRSE